MHKPRQQSCSAQHSTLRVRQSSALRISFRPVSFFLSFIGEQPLIVTVLHQVNNNDKRNSKRPTLLKIRVPTSSLLESVPVVYKTVNLKMLLMRLCSEF